MMLFRFLYLQQANILFNRPIVENTQKFFITLLQEIKKDIFANNGT